MKTFEIYKWGVDEYRAVKHGFSFPGCVLQWIWLVYKGMYVRGTLFFLAYVLLGNLIYGMEKDASPLLYGLRVLIPVLEHPPLIENEILRVSVGLFRTVAFGLVIGAFGNGWYRENLLKRGFSHVTNVEAPKAKVAIEHARNGATRAMTLLKLPEDELQEARLQILAELRQSDSAAANEAYARMVNLISSPWVIFQSRMVHGTTAIQRWLNVVIYSSRAQWLLLVALLLAGTLSDSKYFFGIPIVFAMWWAINKIQFRLNIELAARLITLQKHMGAMALSTIALVDATRESLRAIAIPRFFETERGYQAELLAELRKRLPTILALHDDAIIEQEYQKRVAVHGLNIRPDLVIHVPFDEAHHSDRKQGNYACFELKRKATAAEARADYENLSRLMEALNYPVGIFINLDSRETHISEAPKAAMGQFFSFAVSLRDGIVELHEEHT